MSRFDHNYAMTEADVIDYVREKMPGYFSDGALECCEFGDGNINYIFRVREPETGRSIIIKHALDITRSNGNPISTDRNRIEAEILALEGQLSPSHVPTVYLYDPVMCCLIMQDIGDHRNLRHALVDHETFPTLAEDIAEFMAETLMRTSDFIMAPDEKKEKVGRFINPSMCDISERLVFTDPYTNASGHNILIPENKEFLERELYHDNDLLLEAAKLKYDFQTKAQALLHGDLHSGSILVKEGSTMALDPEFAYYGPIGYDVGNVQAHLIFAWANAQVTMEGQAREDFQHWVEETLTKTLDLFTEKSAVILEETTDPMFRYLPFIQGYLQDVLADTAGYTGTEVIRRVIGTAKVADITTITDPSARAFMERICVYAAKDLILHRANLFRTGKEYAQVLHTALEKAQKS